MSDSTQQYITARPVTMDELGAWFTNEVVKEPLFQPLDIPYIEKQLEDQFVKFHATVLDSTDKALKQIKVDKAELADIHDKAMKVAIAEIKVLFGLEKEETE